MSGEKYADKPTEYFGHVNMHVASRITGKRLHILDIGCGRGALMKALKQEKDVANSYGVEIFPGAAADARQAIDQVWEGSIEEIDLPIPRASLDYVICGDVLEHLREPELVLQKIRPLLKSDGRIIVSLPNVCNRRVLSDLIFHNEWRYAPSGIMDATHLRWFTQKSAKRFLADAGFEVTEATYVCWGNTGRLIAAISANLLTRFVAAQLFFVARVRNP